jgi:hypothetical protein
VKREGPLVVAAAFDELLMAFDPALDIVAEWAQEASEADWLESTVVN